VKRSEHLARHPPVSWREAVSGFHCLLEKGPQGTDQCGPGVVGQRKESAALKSQFDARWQIHGLLNELAESLKRAPVAVGVLPSFDRRQRLGILRLNASEGLDCRRSPYIK
jgi:hypothetical protein